MGPGAAGGSTFASPLILDIMSKTIITGDGSRYTYFVPNPIRQTVCCGVPCGGPTFKNGFFMDFAKGKDIVRFQEMKPKCCQCDANFVKIFRNDQQIGHLEKPCRVCDQFRESCEDCCGSDIMMMSFRNDVGQETESFTVRRKGQGCCSGCCGCLACCGCTCCKGCSMKCCGSMDTATTMNETFEVYGKMDEPMEAPKGTLTISNRRGLLFGPMWVPNTAQIDAPGLTDENDMLLLLGFAYGLIYQRQMNPVSFPAFTGALCEVEGQGVGCS